jgi:hypothetical protein
MQTITENTEAVIYGMLTENTGTHFLDSGGTDGRAWQRNAAKTLEAFRAAPEAVFEGGEWPEVSKSAFWHLVNNLKHDADLTAAYRVFDESRPNDSYFETIEEWLDKLGVASEGDGDFYSARWSFNTYNFDGWLVDQTIQGTFFELGPESYLIMQVHGGADVRGGYTKPQVFRTYGRDEFILGGQDAYFGCSSEECGNKLSVRGYSELELFDEANNLEERFTDLKEVKSCPCGGSWIN